MMPQTISARYNNRSECFAPIQFFYKAKAHKERYHCPVFMAPAVLQFIEQLCNKMKADICPDIHE